MEYFLRVLDDLLGPGDDDALFVDEGPFDEGADGRRVDDARDIARVAVHDLRGDRGEPDELRCGPHDWSGNK